MLWLIIRNPAFASERHKAPRRLAANKEAAKTADAPKVLELLRRKFPELDAAVIAGIENDEVGGIALFARIEGLVEQADDVGLIGRIGEHGFRAAAVGEYGGGDLFDFLPRSAADQHVIAFRGKTPAQRRAQPQFGADADHDSNVLAHLMAS